MVCDDFIFDDAEFARSVQPDFLFHQLIFERDTDNCLFIAWGDTRQDENIIIPYES